MPPVQALGDKDLVDAAPLDWDALLLVEVDLQAVERPGAKGPAQVLRVGQGRGDDLGDLLGRIGGRASGAGLVLQPIGPLGVDVSFWDLKTLAFQAVRPGKVFREVSKGVNPDEPCDVQVSLPGRAKE